MDHKCLQGHQVVMTSKHLYLYSTSIQYPLLLPNWSVKYLDPANIIYFHGLPFVRDKSTLWGVIMRSTFNMASDHLHSHHVSENCQVFKLSLIKWGSARCHSRDRNRVLISKENSISLPPLFLRSASRHVGYEGIFVDLFVFSTIRAELGRLSAKLRYKFVFS